MVTPQSTEVKRMFASIAGSYDLGNTVLSFGMHHLWKRKLVHSLPAVPGQRVLDICTGTGDLLPLLHKRYGAVIGVDFCFPMLALGQQKHAQPNGASYALVQGDALSLPFADESFDIVSVAFGVRNFEDLRTGLREMKRVTKQGGKILVLEFGQPTGFLFGPLYRFYSRYLMPLIGGVITGNKAAYTYLPKTAEQFPCGAQFEAVLEEVGLQLEASEALTGGIAYIYVAAR